MNKKPAYHDLEQRIKALEEETVRSGELQAALKESEEKFHVLADSTPTAVMLYQDDRYIYVNRAAEIISGYSAEELIGMVFWNVVHPDYKLLMQEHGRKRQQGEATTNRHELKIITKDGTEKWVDLTGASTMIGGRPAGIISVADIAGRKQMEEDLRRSEEKYRTILENIEDGYAEIDLRGNFIFFNAALCKIQGYPKDELINLNYRQLLDEENAKKMFQEYNKVYTTGESEKNVECEIIAKGGIRKSIESSITPIKDPVGRIIAFRGILRDVTERRQAEEALRQSEERYRTIMEEMDNGYFEVDLAGNYIFVNDAISRLLGYPKEELLGKTFRDQVKTEDTKILYNAFGNIFKTGKPERGIFYKSNLKDGTNRFAEISGFPLQNQKGEIIGFRGIGRDITERRLMEEALRQSEERYRTIMEEIDEWYFETDLSGNILFFNDAITRALGDFPSVSTRLNFRAFFNQTEADAVYEKFHQVYETGKSIKNFPLTFIKPDGSTIFAEISILPKRNQKGNIYEFRGVGHDITERKLAEERIQYLATYDGLTGLPNRILFSQLLNHAIQSARRHKGVFAVFFIDLDRFKIINDTLGHDAGDRLLQEMSVRFKQSLRELDTVARLGGDEFVVLIEEIGDVSYVATVAQKILSAAIRPMTILGEECRVTASIGISIYPKDGEDEQTLMKNADVAMYYAKEEGKNNFKLYSKDIKSQSVERLSLETKLRFALERNELSLQYQAKLDVKTGAITGVEALLRWNSPDLGPITPTQFIPVAEETGMIVSIGRWVLKTVCVQNVVWQRQGLPMVCMAVNLSARQLADARLIEDIEKALEDSSMDPNLLEIEITESMVMHNPVHMIDVLTRIKNLGVRLAIDDFGTGYSSLANIKKFPIDTLKIDRSFIHDIMQNPEDKAITQAIISMGKTLSLNVVAEGVENQEQMNFLQEQSCDGMQGFYFSKPIDPDKFADLLKNHLPYKLEMGGHF
ncbi:MAG: PAS/PAC sensor-containing diguanylate cyclase/phosphodiesterase [Syntrophaceae bacterium]|nr:MAG: PAS/PAC sensor-containing diguanylate cyclase/phosphodiesterase [Syntrophaceae bacterium]